MQLQNLVNRYGTFEAVPEEEKCLSAIQPSDLMEARRRLIQQDILISAKPKCMFKRR